MKDSLLIGMALGFIAGAIVVTQNSKSREIVERGKKAVKDQVKKMID